MTDDTDIGEGSGKFPATRHSAVLAAQSPNLIERERGLAILLATYWKPVYKYIRIRYRESNEDAKDLTQSFFTRALEKEFFAAYDPEKGTFRTYLRTCLDRFIANEKKAERRQKRSPDAPVYSLDFEDAEGELARAEPSDGLTMEQYFHNEFVRSLFAMAVEKLREECALRGKDLPFKIFERYELDRDPDDALTYEKLSEELHVPVTQVTNFLAFARREFRRVVLETLREITASDHEFREEAKSLLGVAQ